MASTTLTDDIGTNDGTLTNYTGTHYDAIGGEYLVESGNPASQADVPSSISALQSNSLAFDGTGDFAEVTSTAFTDTPFTVSLWIKTTDTSAAIWFLGDKDVIDNFWSVEIDGSGKAMARTVVAAGESSAVSTTSINDGSWHHVAATFASSTAREIFVDGTSEGSDATSRAPVGADRVSIGHLGDSSPSGELTGNVARVQTFNVELSGANITSLAGGTDITANLTNRWALDGEWLSGDYPSAWAGTNSLSFDGADDFSTHGSQFTQGGASAMAAAVWVYPTKLAGAVSWGRGIMRSTSASEVAGNWAVTVDANGMLSVYMWENSGADTNGRHQTANGAVVIDQWQHIAFSWSGSAMTIWVDGSTVAVASRATTANGWGAADEIGRMWNGGGYWWYGRLFDVRTYSDELTQANVDNLYAGVNVSSNLTAQWLSGVETVTSIGGCPNTKQLGLSIGLGV